MVFSLRVFIKKGLLDAVGKLPDYKVVLNALGWYEKEVLTEADLAEIQAAIEAQYPVEEPDTTEEEPEPTEEEGE